MLTYGAYGLREEGKAKLERTAHKACTIVPTHCRMISSGAMVFLRKCRVMGVSPGIDVSPQHVTDKTTNT